jgi:Flp pilus assembly protein TadD
MRRFRTEWAVGLVLAGAVLAGFWPALGHGFVDMDDADYVTMNSRVQGGLSWSNTAWAFTTRRASNWHPLTWLSLQADAALFGLEPRGFHAVNVALHAAATVALFAALRLMTGAVWRPAFAAALFAVHPLRVESVAWVAERKDVLSGLFAMLALLAYGSYVRSPGVGRYLLVVLALALGLLAKPMLVTLPPLLLLLDYWPLQRTSGGWRALPRPLAEKVPLFLLAAASCAVTLWAQADAAASLASVPFGTRLANALVAYVAYLGKVLWPLDLAALYPYPVGGVGAGRVVGAAAVLLTVTALVFWSARSRPYLAVGWLWYLVSLVPVIGLVQVGSQAMADRYTYLPCVGLAIMAAWGVADLASRPQLQKALAAAAVAVLAVLLVLTRAQVHVWRDDVALWEHTLAVTGPDNPFAHNALGIALKRLGRSDEAIRHFREGLKRDPGDAGMHGNLGATLFNAGYPEQALPHLAAAARDQPGNPTVQHDLGLVLYQLGRNDRAVEHFRAAVEATPDFAVLRFRLGKALARQGQLQEATAQLRQAAEREPERWAYRATLAYWLNHGGDAQAAAAQYAAASRLNPNWLPEQGRAAWELASHPEARRRNGIEALDLAEPACDATGWKKPEYADILAAAYAAAGRFPEAAATARKALALLPSSAETAKRAEAMRQRLALYESGQALPVKTGTGPRADAIPARGSSYVKDNP